MQWDYGIKPTLNCYGMNSSIHYIILNDYEQNKFNIYENNDWIVPYTQLIIKNYIFLIVK